MPKTMIGIDETDFWNRIQQLDPDDCWEWIGHRNDFGFPVYVYEGEIFSAQRILYYLTRRKICDRRNVLHVCKRSGCMNPKHLVLSRELSQEELDHILRLAFRYPIREIAKLTGQTYVTVQRVVKEYRDSLF